MAPNVIASPALIINGLRTEFVDTYTAIRNRQSSGMLPLVMDTINATNRVHDFAYIEAGPHMELWRRGDPIPQDAMGSVSFSAVVHNWGRRVKWHKDDRADDQTQSLLDAARMAGESYGLLPERMLFDLITGTATTLPVVPNAPDGAGFFATTAGGVSRFGVANGNLLTGTGVASIATVLADYYKAIQQFMLFKDGKDQPLLSPETIQQGVLILHAAADLQVMEQAFLQRQQPVVFGSNTAAAGVSNIVQDASRNIKLWGSPRLATGDWYVFLLGSPKKPTFKLDRKSLTEATAFEGDNNSDHTRTTGEEYIQWDARMGAGIGLPYGAIKINN